MFSVLKFIWIVCRAFPALMNVRTNALAHVPDQTKWLAMIMLGSFWALAFSLYIGELWLIGYNIMGHVAIITMVFVTWWTFKNYREREPRRREIDYLRTPDRSSRCDELTDEQREAAIVRLNRNTWNEPKLTKQDQYRKENENVNT